MFNIIRTKRGKKARIITIYFDSSVPLVFSFSVHLNIFQYLQNFLRQGVFLKLFWDPLVYFPLRFHCSEIIRQKFFFPFFPTIIFLDFATVQHVILENRKKSNKKPCWCQRLFEQIPMFH